MMNSEEFRIIDAHLHTYGTFLGKDKDLLEYMDEFGIEKAILTTINRAASSKVYLSKDDDERKTSNEDTFQRALNKFQSLLSKGQLDHQDVINLSSKAPDRFYKFFWFNPKVSSDMEEESYEILAKHFDMGFCGVKIHSGINMLKIPKDIEKLVSFMQDYNKSFPLFIHSTPKVIYFGGISSKDIGSLAKKFPELNIIIGHAAYAMEYAIEAGTLLKQFKNVYFETSCSIPYGIYNLVKMVGIERIIFGSDAPVTNPIYIEIEKIKCLPLKKEQKQSIFYDNVLKLLNKIN
ncbi:MAG: amidohydrolase family protein [Promethearchaeota archaeon]